MKRLHKKFRIPIWDADVYLLVCMDPTKEWGRYQDIFKIDPPTDAEGFSATNKSGSFLLFLRSDKLNWAVLGHEVYHLTNQILEWCNVCDPEHHESGAHLCGYLTGTIYTALKCLKS